MIDLRNYVYVGGGYYRDKRVPKGKTAPMIHGQEVIEEALRQLNANKEQIRYENH
jgi:hypothetical protein